MSFPTNPSYNDVYSNPLGTRWRYDGTAWQIDGIIGYVGSTGIQGITGLQGYTGLQGTSGSALGNDGTRITFTDYLSVSQSKGPVAYYQVYTDATKYLRADNTTWTIFRDWKTDISSAGNLLTHDGTTFTVGTGGDGTYSVGYAVTVATNSISTVLRAGIYKDGTRVYGTAQINQNNSEAQLRYEDTPGLVLLPLSAGSTLDMRWYHNYGIQRDFTCAPGAFMYANRIGR